MDIPRLMLYALFPALLLACSGDKAQELLDTAQLEEQQRNLPHAKQLYDDVIRLYPDSKEADTARARLAQLNTGHYPRTRLFGALSPVRDSHYPSFEAWASAWPRGTLAHDSAPESPGRLLCSRRTEWRKATPCAENHASRRNARFCISGHKEVRGIIGWTADAGGRSQATVVKSPDLEDLKQLVGGFPGGFPNKIALMAQTTHKVEDFARFVANLMLLQRDHNFEFHVVNTLCHATTGQQEATATLAREVDLMIVVGGRKSANTRHLREVCEEQGTPAFHIESPDELEASWFEGVARVGLTAGASTPDSSIDDVEARIRAFCKFLNKIRTRSWR